ncbi:MAG TPA: cytidylate kinase-like family protein [Thermodesulfobacteriota bacterium]|nr:cytidylate kinase-like family protein [Thermodesulfobacteriota bacterium]
MKIKKSRPIQLIIEDQVNRWKSALPPKEEKKITVVTVSRQAGSGGHILAQQIAQKLSFDFFDQEITHAVADNAHMRTLVVESLDEKGVSAIDDMISAVVEKHHLWGYEYMQHLLRVIATIGKHGNAVILGRGANFILPREEILRVRVIAPLTVRVKNITEWLKLSPEQAKEYIQKIDLERREFIKKYFKADIDDPEHNDLVINLEKLNIEAGIEIVKAALESL